MEIDQRHADHHDFWAFVVPATICVEISVGGRLFLSELLLLCLLPGLLSLRGRGLSERAPRRILLLATVWLAMQVYTDFVRGTPFADWSRGWSKIVFFILNYSAISLLLNGQSRRYILFAYGLLLGSIVQYFVAPSIYAGQHPWKFGVGTAVTTFLVLVAQRNRSDRTTCAVILGLACVANLVFGYRSMAAFCFVTLVFALFQHRAAHIRGRTLLLAFVVSAFAISQVYAYAAGSGLLGAEAKEKYEQQASGEFGLLLGARVELFASTQAVIDSPIVGHGSWAKDVRYVDVLNERLAAYGYEIATDPDEELVPAHSYFMGAWVDGGIAGAAFWLWIAAVVLVAMLASLRAQHELSLLIVFNGCSLLWAIFFSPFGAESRLHAAFGIALMLTGSAASLRKRGSS
jgi:hypothetical protein